MTLTNISAIYALAVLHSLCHCMYLEKKKRTFKEIYKPFLLLYSFFFFLRMAEKRHMPLFLSLLWISSGVLLCYHQNVLGNHTQREQYQTQPGTPTMYYFQVVNCVFFPSHVT